MIKKIAANDRYHLEADWLSAYWLFSFDRYYDPNNMAFGALRVFNHDTIQGGAGFPTHSHREMEIVTYVLEGKLAHKDSTGGVGFINPRRSSADDCRNRNCSFGIQRIRNRNDETTANMGHAGARRLDAFLRTKAIFT